MAPFKTVTNSNGPKFSDSYSSKEFCDLLLLTSFPFICWINACMLGTGNTAMITTDPLEGRYWIGQITILIIKAMKAKNRML